MNCTKGQLISKCLFGVFTFFQETNGNKVTSSKVQFVHSFFGRNVSLKKSFRICLTFKLNFFNTFFLSKQIWHLLTGSIWREKLRSLLQKGRALNTVRRRKLIGRQQTARSAARLRSDFHWKLDQSMPVCSRKGGA